MNAFRGQLQCNISGAIRLSAAVKVPVGAIIVGTGYFIYLSMDLPAFLHSLCVYFCMIFHISCFFFTKIQK